MAQANAAARDEVRTPYQNFSLRDVFNVPAPAGYTIEGWADVANPYIPRLDPHYEFRRDELRPVAGYLRSPGPDGVYIWGPKGSGKTSLVTQCAARLNWPVSMFSCHERTDINEMLGQWVPMGDKWGWLDGPLTMAARYGHICIINEVDRAEPGNLSALHDVLDGLPLVLAAKGGEVVRIHPKFRLFCTANSGGGGDPSGLHQGVKRQDTAFMDRFVRLKVTYAEDSVELKILERAVPNLPENYRTAMVKTANEIRGLYMGQDDAQGELSDTMSTRTLVRWARLSLQYKGAPNAIKYALDLALTGTMDASERMAVHTMAKGKFGDLWRDEADHV